jgi:uncharacterized membrane protein
MAINAPVAQVWQAVVCQTDRIGEWMPHVIEARLLSGRPDQIGSRVDYRVDLLGIERAYTDEITDVVDHQYLAYCSVSGRVREHGYWRFESVGASHSRLTFFMAYRLPGAILGRVVDALVVHQAMEDRITEGLHNLKRRCETAAHKAA